MTINAAVIQLLRESIGDEIRICDFEDYFKGNTQNTTRVRDIVKENGNLIILV